jgi:N-dimethylarginine dimethylaminohydrolase
VPVLRTVSGRGTFEGADALWLDRRTVVCGVGNRTNAEGFRQLREVLAAQGVAAVAAPMPKGVQHLLGLLQIVDAKLALLRHEKAPKALARLLKRRRFRVVPIPESAEVVAGQGMNVVTVSPRRIVMPADCPRLGEIYRSAGLHVAGTADVRQLRLAAGGLACAVGILSRAPRPTPSYKPAPRLAATASRDGR